MKKIIYLIIIVLFLGVFSCDDDSTNNNDNNQNNNNQTNNNNQNNNNQTNNGNNQNTPSVFSLSPSRGSIAGGTEVTIYGKDFTSDVSVYFGDSIADTTFVNSSSLIAITPSTSSVGPVDVKVSQISGEFTLSGGFIYESSENIANISWCIFQAPSSVEIPENSVTPYLYGRVYAEGFTDSPGQGQGITAQVGYGPEGTDPSTDASWIWVSATYNVDVGDGANDEYMAAITPVGVGNFDISFRFSGGDNWIYCDLDGSDNGYDSSTAAKLTVTEQGEPMPNWCILQYPPTLTGTTDATLDMVYGRVYIEGVTDNTGAGNGIVAQVGYGPLGTQPASDPGWQWFDASYNADTDNNSNDEYLASFSILQPGQYAYAYRFAYLTGPWLYCDLNGSDDGYSPAMQGIATVDGTSSNTPVDWCKIQYPDYTSTMINTDSPLFYGRVFVSGITDGNGQGQGITAQVGYGPLESDPTADTSGWTFVDADYNVSVDGLVTGDLANDEYMASLNIDYPQLYSVVYRFSADGGNTWKYCDLDGTDNGFDATNVSTLEVTDATTQSVNWCIFQYPSSLNFSPGTPTESLYGRVFMTGVTEGAGQGAGITAQVGYGPLGSDPTFDASGWTFANADYNVSVDGLVTGDLANDEYIHELEIPTAGSYSLIYRFSADGGITWTYCDLDGSDNDVDENQLPTASSSK